MGVIQNGKRKPIGHRTEELSQHLGCKTGASHADEYRPGKPALVDILCPTRQPIAVIVQPLWAIEPSQAIGDSAVYIKV
jgi:hypothetical protein